MSKVRQLGAEMKKNLNVSNSITLIIISTLMTVLKEARCGDAAIG